MLKLRVILFLAFLLRICANFYGNSSRNKKVTRFYSKIAFLKEIPLSMLTSQNKTFFRRVDESFSGRLRFSKLRAGLLKYYMLNLISNLFKSFS